MLTTNPSGVSTAPGQAQAYCGPAHGQRWLVEAGSGPPAVVQLQTTGGTCAYRLLVHPRTHGPARDHQCRYPYLPVALGACQASPIGEPAAIGGRPGAARPRRNSGR
jgi:hypothetical protein